MNQDPKDIIIKVLDIINYQKDKESYAKEFLGFCYQKAFLSYLETLPEEKQKELQQQLPEGSSPEKVKELLSGLVSTQEYEQSLEKAIKEVFDDYLKEIMPSLSEDQITNLQAYLSSLAPAQSPPQQSI